MTYKRRKPTQKEQDAREAKLAQVQATLATEIEKLCNGKDWQRMLEATAKFYNFSWRNWLLIMVQCPQTRGYVANAKQWKEKFNRHIISGPGSGLAILAPVFVKRTKEDSEETESILIGYRVTYVFDLSQTDGDPFPEVKPALLEGEAPAGVWDALVAHAEADGFEVRREHVPGMPAANGSMDPDTGIIRVRPELVGAQAVKTLTHELAHWLCGHDGHGTDPRSQMEIEAESIAYVVGTQLGMDTSGYTLPYVAGWAPADKRAEVLAQTADKVIKTSKKILERLEAHLELTKAA